MPRCSTYFVIFGLLTCETSAVSRSCWRAQRAIVRRWIAVVGVRKTGCDFRGLEGLARVAFLPRPFELFCKRRNSHSWTRPRFCKAPSPHRAPPRPRTTDVAPKKNTAAKSAMKTNAHNFIHACHMNTLYVMIVLAKLIRAPAQQTPSSVIRRRPSPWAQSVVKGGGDQLSGVHMSDGARTRARPYVPRSPQAWSRPPSGKRGSRLCGPRATTRSAARRS